MSVNSHGFQQKPRNSAHTRHVYVTDIPVTGFPNLTVTGSTNLPDLVRHVWGLFQKYESNRTNGMFGVPLPRYVWNKRNALNCSNTTQSLVEKSQWISATKAGLLTTLNRPEDAARGYISAAFVSVVHSLSKRNASYSIVRLFSFRRVFILNCHF